MERIKLQDPGSELTLAISNVTEEELGGGKYYKCDDGKTELLVPTSAADRQFERLGIVSAGGMVGKTIKFSRSDNMSKSGHPFWNLDLAKPNGAPKPAKQEPRDFTPEQFKDDLPEELREQDEYEAQTVRVIREEDAPPARTYKKITAWVLAEIAPMYVKSDIGLSPEATAAIVATLFIQSQKHESIR